MIRPLIIVGIADAVGLDERIRLLGEGEVRGQDPSQWYPDVLVREFVIGAT